MKDIDLKKEEARKVAYQTPAKTNDYRSTSSIVAGDTIRWTEPVFEGSFRNATYVGDRTIEADVVKESYGERKQQHTFTLVATSSSGEAPVKLGVKFTRKGRNLYRGEAVRRAWVDEKARDVVKAEKHERGAGARAARDTRKSRQFGW